MYKKSRENAKNLLTVFKLTLVWFIKMKIPDGSMKKKAGSSVFRYCTSESQSEFCCRCTVGTRVKVSCLRHE